MSDLLLSSSPFPSDKPVGGGGGVLTATSVVAELRRVFGANNVFVHGSVYYGTAEPGISDLDVWIKNGSSADNIDAVIRSWSDMLRDAPRRRMVANNIAATEFLILRLPNGVELDLNHRRPDALHYMHRLKATLQQPGVRNLYMHMVKTARAMTCMGPRRLSKYRLLWFFHMWDYYHGHDHEVTAENFIAFMREEVIGNIFLVHTSADGSSADFRMIPRRRPHCTQVWVDGRRITPGLAFGTEFYSSIAALCDAVATSGL